MVFQSDTYSVLLVSASEKVNTVIASLLPPTDFWPVTTVRSISQARRLSLENPFDLILVNDPLTDGSGISYCMDLCTNGESGVLLMVRNEIYEETYYKVLPYGVIVLSKPTDIELIRYSLRMLCAMRERLRMRKKKQETVEEKMQELRLVNQAKLVLMERNGISEEEAHRMLLRRAMEQRVSKKEAAEWFLRSYSIT